LEIKMRSVFREDHEIFRSQVRRFVDREIVPHHAQGEHDGIVPKEVWRKAGREGLLCVTIPEKFGGPGGDVGHAAVLIEELARANATAIGFTTHSDIAAPYLLAYGSEEQKLRWLPSMASGELICAIAMTEPGIGSDLASMSTSAIRHGDEYVVNGSKTFITNGINADLVIVVVKTDPSAGAKGISLLAVERDTEGFTRGARLEKIGLHAQDTAELFFTDARVPRANLLGEEGKGFGYLSRNLPQERLAIATIAVAAARAAFDLTLDYVTQRKAFGQLIGSFQNSRFAMAEMLSEISIAQAYVDQCVLAHLDGELTAEEAAMAKWWCSELQNRVADRCLQLHGGYGYMTEYPVARAFVDARVQKIYGGTNEIMKEIIGRSIGL
jgi:alkylation response protein AidB-like acyl-CoA dehydrogenase